MQDDICLCSGKECPMKKDCLRANLEPVLGQSFFKDPPYNPETKECDFYWGKKRTMGKAKEKDAI